MSSFPASVAAPEEISKYEPVIGLEVHVQLATRTKIFCSCPTSFAAEPNSNFCPVLPKGYQISQYDQPVAGYGVVEILLDADIKRIGITRVHMEDDAGKS